MAAENKREIKIGDLVELIGLPEWLLADLPEDEQKELRGFIGEITSVTDIDSHGYFWLGFGNTKIESGISHCSGHSFCVTREFINPI